MAGEHAPPPVHPNEAAKQLRVLSYGLIERLKNWAAASEASDATMYWASATDYGRRVEDRLLTMEHVIETRRVVEMREALRNLRSSVRHERDYRTYAFNAATGHGNQSSTIKQLQVEAKHISELVQQLPTVPDLPVGNMQNMLRAIMAILRTGGYEGAEELTWEEVTKNGNHKEAEENGNEGTVSVDDVVTIVGNATTSVDAIDPF